ncbi:hypothetical protein PCK2_000559 [Pneumocystis canis]|nr:hypothetical protein PCK2_000559 [Pneumocystis canis]
MKITDSALVTAAVYSNSLFLKTPIFPLISYRNELLSIKTAQEELDRAKTELEHAQREGDYARASELQYSIIPELQKKVPKEGDLDKTNSLLHDSVTSDDIALIVSKATGIPTSNLMRGEKDKLLSMEEVLRKKIRGQDQALKVVANAVRLSRAGLQDEKRPLSSFLFLGSTGVGKTALCKALAEFLFDSENAMIRFDMSEFQEKHKLIEKYKYASTMDLSAVISLRIPTFVHKSSKKKAAFSIFSNSKLFRNSARHLSYSLKTSKSSLLNNIFTQNSSFAPNNIIGRRAGLSTVQSMILKRELKQETDYNIKKHNNTSEFSTDTSTGMIGTRPIYLDMQSTTPVDPRVLDAMLPYYTYLYGNSHSRTHSYGWETDRAVQIARQHVANLIGADPKEIFFTSGATESNNMLIKGVAHFYSNTKKHIITAQTEHKCVLDSCRILQNEGFDVTYLPVNRQGVGASYVFRGARVRIEPFMSSKLRGTVLPPSLPLLNIFWSPENVRGTGNSSSFLNFHLHLLKIFALLGFCNFAADFWEENADDVCSKLDSFTIFAATNGGNNCGGGGGGGLIFTLFEVVDCDNGGGGGGGIEVIGTDAGSEILRVGGGGGGSDLSGESDTDLEEMLFFGKDVSVE